MDYGFWGRSPSSQVPVGLWWMQGALLFRRMVSWCYTFDKLCSPLPIKTKKRPGGQREQGHGVVLHDKGEGYQQSITFWMSHVQLGSLYLTSMNQLSMQFKAYPYRLQELILRILMMCEASMSVWCRWPLWLWWKTLCWQQIYIVLFNLLFFDKMHLRAK